MINRRIKKIYFCYTIISSMFLFLLSATLSAREFRTADTGGKPVPFINIKTADAQVSANKAKEIALAHAGVSEAAANFKKIKLDNKNGKTIYEIEFIAGGTRYEFEIDATNGSVIKYEKR